jgi:hypothetical protein
MQLLDLTPEPFQRIIHVLVEDVGTAKAFKYRLVSSES